MISDKSIDFVNSCRKDLEIGVIDKATIKFSKDQSRAEIKKTKKFTVSNFEDYDSWLSQRTENDTKITNEDKLLHKEMHNFIKEKYSGLELKLRKKGSAFYHNNGKKVGNLYLTGRNGVSLTMIRSEEDGYKFPNMTYVCKNLRNDVKNCEYFNVINITNLDDSIKKVIEESYNIRDKNKKLLKSNHPKINEILGVN